MESPRVEKTATRARQGARGKPVLVILIASLAAIVILYFLVGAFMTRTSPDSAVQGAPAAGISTAPADTGGAAGGAATGATVTPSEGQSSLPAGQATADQPRN